MVKMSATYTGDLHCKLIHGPSQSELETDAPKDNHGKGEKFSPTDLVGAALASCVLTTLALVAERDGVSVVGSRAEIVKEMSNQPRRIGTLKLSVYLSKQIPEEYRSKLERAAQHCPVHKSLHPDIQIPFEFFYE